MLKQYKVVIFDWDGTVMDSIGHIVTCIQAAATKYQLAVPDEQAVRDIIGMSLPNAFEQLFSVDALCLFDEFRESYKDNYHAAQNHHSPMYEHVNEVVQHLHARGTMLAVATGKGRNGLDSVLESSGLAEYFSYSRTSDEAQSKPHPDMLMQIMAFYGVNACDCVMIGDSVHDLNMAKNAQMDAIGVTFGAHSREKLSVTQPMAIVDSYEELLLGLS